MNTCPDATPLMLQSLDIILETSPDMIFMKYTDLTYCGCSQAFAHMVGQSDRHQLIGKTDFDFFPHDLASRYTIDDRDLMASGISIIDRMEPLPDKDGGKNYSSTSKYIIYDHDGAMLGLLGIARDITAQMNLDHQLHLLAKLEHQAAVDSLTGLANRSSVMSQIEDCITGYGVEGTHALLFVDLDYFKQVNDCLGHPAGDNILRHVSQMLGQLFSHEIIGRVGGDEFLVLLRNITSAEDARTKAERIFECVPFFKQDEPYQLCVSCSVGIALYQNDRKPLSQLYSEADQAMYRAKQSGKSCAAFF